MIDISTASHAKLDELAQDQEARQGQKVLDQVYAFIGRFVSYPSEAARIAHAVWIVHAHAMQLWESTPRIAFLSPEPSSGKTRALEVTETLVPRPIQTVNVSPNYLFRKVASENGQPTVLFDEIDTIFGPKAKENEEIRGWLNAGHRRGATAGRCVVRGKIVETEELPAFCAVAVAGLGWLPDTILTRSVIIRMRRRHANENVEPWRGRIHSKQALPIKMAIEAWAKSIPEIEKWPELPTGIQDRDADVWEALVTVADLAGGSWPSHVRTAAVTLVTAAKEAEPSLGIRLLTDLKTIFGNEDQLQTATILQSLRDLEESPWADLKGKPLDDRALALRLRPYGVKSKTIRFGSTQAKGYTRADLKDPWLRYLPQPPATSVSSVPSVPANDVTDGTAVTLLRQKRETDRCQHCGGNGPDVLECAISGDTVRLHRNCIDAWTDLATLRR